MDLVNSLSVSNTKVNHVQAIDVLSELSERLERAYGLKRTGGIYSVGYGQGSVSEFSSDEYRLLHVDMPGNIEARNIITRKISTVPVQTALVIAMGTQKSELDVLTDFVERFYQNRGYEVKHSFPHFQKNIKER